MLGSSKCNIYVSITDSHAVPIDGESEHIYRKPRNAWFISVEPKKHHIPGTSHPEPIHYGAVLKDETYSISTHSVNSVPEVLGTILVAEKTSSTPEHILQVLQQHLSAGPSTLPSQQTSEDEPEHWIRKALHILQAQKIIEAFDVGEFMTYAHAYAANRHNCEGPAMVAYPKLDKEHEKKAKKDHFWVDYPEAAKPNPRRGFGQDQK